MMSKLYLIFFIMLISSSSFAQFITGYGVKIGMVLSNQKFAGDLRSQLPPSTFKDLDTRPGPIMNIFMEFYDEGFFNFYAEMNYHQSGTQGDFMITTVEQPEGTGEFLTSDLSMQEYIGLNFSGKLTYKHKHIHLYFLAGPSINIEIKNRGILFFYPDDFNRTSSGILIGSGFELPNLITPDLIFEVRYNLDISNAAENERLSLKYRLWEFLIGIRL